MNLHLENKVTLITGSSAGIGFAIAAGFAAEGARVIVNGRSEKRVHSAISAILEQYPNANLEPLVADLATAEAAKQAVARFPAVDVLVLGRRRLRHEGFQERSQKRDLPRSGGNGQALSNMPSEK